MDLRRKQEEAERLKEAKEAANKKEKMRIIKEQVKPDMFTTEANQIKLCITSGGVK